MKKPIIISVLFFIINSISSFGHEAAVDAIRPIIDEYGRQIGRLNERDANAMVERGALENRINRLEREIDILEDNQGGNGQGGNGDNSVTSELDRLDLRISNAEGAISDNNRGINSNYSRLSTEIAELRNDHLGLKSSSGTNTIRLDEIQKKVNQISRPENMGTFNIVYQNINDISDQLTMVLEVPSILIKETPNLEWEFVEGSSVSVTRGDVTENFNDVTIIFNSNNVPLDLTKELVGQAGLSGRDADNIVGEFNLTIGGLPFPPFGEWFALDKFLIGHWDGSRYKLTSLKYDYEPPVTIQSNKSEIDTIKNEMETMKAQLQTLVASVAEKDAQLAEKDAKIAELEQGGGGQSLEQVLEQVRDARAGSVVLTVDPEGDTVTLGLTIEQSDNLIEWTKLEGEITRTIPIPDGKNFYRFALDKSAQREIDDPIVIDPPIDPIDPVIVIDPPIDPPLEF